MSKPRRVEERSREAFRVDAKAEGECIVIGGWEVLTSQSADRGRWFSIHLNRRNAPWAYMKGEPFRNIATLELTAVLVAVILFGDRLVDNGCKNTLTLSASTDNLGNTHVLQHFMSCKFPLSIVVMELAMQLKKINLELDLGWVPRNQNIEADALTNSDFTGFCPSKRIEKDFEDMQFIILNDLVNKAGEMDEEIKLAKSSKELKGDRPEEARHKKKRGQTRLVVAPFRYEAGCSFLTVHGRQRDRALHHAPARWEAVRLVRDALKIPVASNGGVSSYDSALRCLEETKCVAVMVATGLLQNPELFLPVTEAETEDDASTTCASGSSKPSLAQGVRHCLMYLQICERAPPFSVRWARDHLRALMAGTSKLDLLALLDAVPAPDAAHSLPQDLSAFAAERKIHWKEICQDFRDVIKTISVHEGLCTSECSHWKLDLPWGTARGPTAQLKGSTAGYSLVVEGASAAQQALLRGAPVSKRFAERQKQRALAIKSCFQATSRLSERRKTQAT
eukprot:s306_g8.t1